MVLAAAIGDSLTASGWVRLACESAGLTYIESARNGAPSEVIRRELLPVALAAKPDVCVVLAGSNDVAHGRVPIRELGRIWLAVRRSGARLVVAMLPPHEIRWRGATAQIITNQIIRGVGLLPGVHRVELNGPLGGRRWALEYRHDFGHPNDAGVQRMADELLPVLRHIARQTQGQRRSRAQTRT